RNGNFHIDAAGNLLTSTGDSVMGDLGPIQLPGGEVSFSSDGTISQSGAVIANLKLVEFKPGTQFSAQGKSYYQAPAGSEIPAADPRLSQGGLESSNMDPVTGTVGLMLLQRHAQL